MSVFAISQWHKKARPNPTYKDFNVQLGCHVEEFVEMLDSLVLDGYYKSPLVHRLTKLADGLKQGSVEVAGYNPEKFLDSLCDQIVTAVGVGHTADMAISTAVAEVNRSNFSKFDQNGNPIKDANGKIIKGPNYAPPDLHGLY